MSIKLMARVWDETKFKGTELLILLCLADHADDDGVCWPSYQRLADRARTTPRWAMACVKRLEDEGFLTLERRGNVGRSNLYTLHIPEGVKKTAGVKPSSRGGAVKFTPPPPLGSTPRVNPTSHEPSDESELNHQEPSRPGFRRDGDEERL